MYNLKFNITVKAVKAATRVEGMSQWGLYILQEYRNIHLYIYYLNNGHLPIGDKIVCKSVVRYLVILLYIYNILQYMLLLNIKY